VERAKGIHTMVARLMLLVFLILAAVGCDNSTTTGGTSTTTTQDPLAREQYGGEYKGGVATGDTEAGAAYAQWVLDQDPQRQIITDAVMRDDSNLGVKVQPNATKGQVRDLLTALVPGMAQRFPDRDLKVIAFFQSGDKMAEATYNRQTQQVDIQFTQ
jgi:hypothetical protein